MGAFRDGQKPLLALRIRVGDAERAFIVERCRSIGKVNAVLQQIGLCLSQVPFEIHSNGCMYVCTLADKSRSECF